MGKTSRQASSAIKQNDGNGAILRTLKHLDLFSGIGGFALAANIAGFETIGFSEIDLFCSKVLKKHWPAIPNYGDIKEFNFNQPVNLITGGFPCQPFSVAGKKKGKNDDRYLWPEFYRIIKQTRPDWIVAENVTGIVAMELDNIIDDLESENYTTQAFIIPACAANAPHRRDRVWIIANRTCKRCDMRESVGEMRYLQNDIIGDVATLQSEWEKLKPESWQAFNAQDWLANDAHTDSFHGREVSENLQSFAEQQKGQTSSSKIKFNNAGINWKTNQPPVPGMDDGLPFIVDRNRALGNAIVPQIAFIFLSIIYKLETTNGLEAAC
jgi:DNA (cytosine-5)-methyltransferase 1